ncbi:hypothetical protein RRG08_066273 [Elysia crispata]|uniref:Uncharacterized protein n=1 Tax=Elysia crispata TaxID=231223 RepID=A0AAE1E4E4_9GAST|nr:hypothetical protein RRG08_066273 [Elysia crispata]
MLGFVFEEGAKRLLKSKGANEMRPLALIFQSYPRAKRKKTTFGCVNFLGVVIHERKRSKPLKGLRFGGNHDSSFLPRLISGEGSLISVASYLKVQL